MIASEVPQITFNSKIKGRTVLQLRGSEVIAQYASMAEAARITGIRRQSINDVVTGKNKSTGGYEWKYA